MEFTTPLTGVIVDAGTDYSVVRVTVNSADKKFSFSKKILYTFGIKCEGDMTNILERGMEVEVFYKDIPKPTIIAVWLGNAPDNLVREFTDSLRPVFDQKGRLTDEKEDYFYAKWDNGLEERVAVHKSVLYRDGCLLDREKGPMGGVGDSITFDVLPCVENKEMYVSSDSPLYAATCAWIGGRTPRVIDRFGLASRDQMEPDDSLIAFENDYVEGIVVIVLNDIVAFADVDLDSVVVKVLLFRSCFRSDQSVAGQSLKHMIAEGDALNLRIRRGRLYPGQKPKQWFAIEARKYCVEISDNIKENCSEPSGAKPSDVGIDTRDGSRTSLVNELDLIDFNTAVTIAPKSTELSTALFKYPPLCGIISQLSSDSASISYKNLKIYVQASDVYIYGPQCSRNQFVDVVSSGNCEVKFEAVQSPSDIKQKHGATYTASRVWIGQKPVLSTVMSSLDPPDFSLLSDKNATFIGTVVKFCLPKLAFIRLLHVRTTASLHVDEFSRTLNDFLSSEIITDFVKLGDCLEFKVRRNGIVLSAFDSKHVNRNSIKETNTDTDLKSEKSAGVSKMFRPFKRADSEPSNVSFVMDTFSGGNNRSEHYSEREKSAGVSKVPHSSFFKHTDSESNVLSLFGDSKRGGNYSKYEKSEGRKSSSKPTDYEYPKHSVQTYPFEKGHTFNGRYWLRNCGRGKLQKVLTNETGGSAVCFKVEHELGSSSLIEAPIVYGLNYDRCIAAESFNACSNREICFDAEVIDAASDKLRFLLQRMWIFEKGRQHPETYLRKELTCERPESLEPSKYKLYRGTIQSIPLISCAIALVNKIPVLVSYESLVTREKINWSYTSLDEFVCVGDEVILSLEVTTFPEERNRRYCNALECWPAEKCKESNEHTGVFSAGRSRFLGLDTWTSDDYFGKGFVSQKGRMYFVDFAHPKRQENVIIFCLDVFAGGKVFVGNTFIGVDEAHVLKGREISYYVAYSREKERTGSSPSGLYVAYAWADEGNRALPWAALDDRLSVPKGLLAAHNRFEGVVECLPSSTNKRGVPQHVLCSIGPLPVLVLYSADNETQKTCSEGDRVSLGIKEQTHDNKITLVSNSIQPRLSFKNLIRLKGKVVVLPRPVGIIKAFSGINVSFELCHVHDETKFGCSSEELSAWFERVSQAIYVGATVSFTAVNVNGKHAPYRALEVWVE